MFDRIAGVYDRMNSVMTAGMHHRWRERAADLAARRPGRPRARRGHRHRRPGGRARAPRVGPAARWSAWTSPRRCSSSPAARRPAIRFEQGNALDAALRRRRVRRRHRRLRRAQLLRPRPGPRRDGAGGAPGRPGGGARDHHARSGRRCRGSSGSGSTGSCPRSAAWPATPTPTPTCRARCAASPGRASWPREHGRRRPRDVRWVLTAGGIIAIHAGTVPAQPMTAAAQLASGAGGRRARRSRAGCARTEARLAEVAASHGARAGRSRRRARSPPAASGCGRCSCSSAADDGDGPAGRRRGRRAAAHGDAGARRRARPRRAAPRPRPPCSPPAAAHAATATGDLLFSRAFAELAATGSAEAVRALSTASSRAGARAS